MGFRPVALRHYIRLHLKSNRGEKEAEVTARLQWALKAFKAGAVCSCGEPIWVIGSAIAGLMCFTCITGSTDNTDDYEIDEACGPPARRCGSPPRLRSRAPRPALDRAVCEEESGSINGEDFPF
jgi:hypothetical protein